MSLWNEELADIPKVSFLEPVPDPGTGPSDVPLVCVQFSQAWQEYVCGALLQLMLATTWEGLPQSQIDDLQIRVTELINLFGEASICVPTQHGNLSMTISAGDGTVADGVIFGTMFLATPDVVCSCDDITLMASWSSVTTSGVNLHLTAATPVLVDTTATVTWVAMA